MKQFFSYLRRYAGWLALCVALLAGQAGADLSLPNLMSEIVSVGILQSGIEDTAPAALSENAMRLLLVFMTDGDKSAVQAGYTKIPAGQGGTGAYAVFDRLNSRYPAAKTEAVYARNPDADTGALGAVFGRASMTMLNYFKEAAAQSGQSAGSASNASLSAGSLTSIDLAPAYEALPLLEQMPPAAFDDARKAVSAMDDSLLRQVANAATGLFYRELDVDTGALRMRYILLIGAKMLLLTLAGMAASILVALISSRTAADLSRRLRRDVFERVENFSNTEFDRFSTASLITRTTNDITQVQMLLVMGIRMLCYAPIMGVGGVVMALKKSVSMSWIIALGVVVVIGLIAVVFSIASPRFKLVQKLIDRLNLIVREHLSGLMVIRAFGTQGFETKRFDKANRDLTDVNLFINRIMVVMMPVMSLLMSVLTMSILWVGAHQIDTAAMQVGDMMAFMQYAMQVVMSFLMISVMFITVPRAAVAVARVSEVLDAEPSVRDPEKPRTLGPRPRGEVEFRHVSFRYHGAEDDVLHDVSFTARPGQTTAFIGSTGSGKSTLVSLIPRFYDVTGGAVLIDGVDIRELTQHELRSVIGYVPQKGVLFSGTIASNLRYGRPEADDRELAEAASTAQAEEFISVLPDGFAHPIAQGGANVSGGQKQRLSIARALAKNAPIQIFDDSFSALDFKTDAALRRALKERTADATVLIVAQRVSTILTADQILVLEEGRVVGRGTHRELLKTCETYREIASSQLTKEELA